jgi:methionyl-tRNA synthetase
MAERSERYLVTAALPYSNGRLHVGHMAGAYIPADIYVRYLRSCGRDVRFICGSDDNGGAIEMSALKEGVAPSDIVAKYHASQEESFRGLGISFDIYGGTHTPGFVDRHNQISQDFFLAIHRKGYFTKRTDQQLFDPVVGKFLADRYVTGVCHHCGSDKAYGDQCENCGRTIDPLLLKSPKSLLSGATPEVRSTTHWYLALSRFEKPLQEWLSQKTDWRASVVNFALGQIREGLPERSMTRDLTWGIPVPLEDPEAAGKVLYVWFDAPIGYVSFTSSLLEREGGSTTDYERYWKSPESKVIHFIGEDNIVFHALIWPAMLMAEGSFSVPTQVVANSFLNIKFPGAEEEKISKSRGTAVWIEDFLQEYEPDSLRYYLTAIAPEGARTAYNPEDFLDRNDGELVAALGNFVNRNVSFAHKYFEGQVPPEGDRDDLDRGMLAECVERQRTVAQEIEAFRFKSALAEMMKLARAGNVYLDQKKPWSQRKESLAACGQTINVCLQVVRTLGVLMEPFLPFAAEKVAEMLGLSRDDRAWDRATEPLLAAHPLGPAQILFRKLREEPPRGARA